MTEYPDHLAVARKLLDQQGEINDLTADLERTEIAFEKRGAMITRLEGKLQKAEATIARVRAECDRIEAAVRDNPQDTAFDAGYLSPLKWIRHALDGTTEGE